jgi:DNA-binding IclR family transcriptional regulator
MILQFLCKSDEWYVPGLIGDKLALPRGTARFILRRLTEQKLVYETSGHAGFSYKITEDGVRWLIERGLAL